MSNPRVARSKAFYAKISPSQQMWLALALFAAATLMSREKVISSLEENIFLATYNLPEWISPISYLITQLGSIYALLLLAAFYTLRKKHRILIRLLMSGTLAYLLAGFAKGIVGRERPVELLSNIVMLDVIQGPGFPSGHVALATALAFTIGHVLTKKYHWIPVVWIVGVAFSRMNLGVHLPLDLVGGFAIGWFAYAVFRQVRIYDNPKSSN